MPLGTAGVRQAARSCHRAISEPNKRWTIPANLAGRPKTAVPRIKPNGNIQFEAEVTEPVEYEVPERKKAE
jgi:hypothetical protein